jgi:antitoxin MazE
LARNLAWLGRGLKPIIQISRDEPRLLPILINASSCINLSISNTAPDFLLKSEKLSFCLGNAFFIDKFIFIVYTLYRLIKRRIYAMQVQRWGNSLAIRLPKSLCQAIGIEEGKELDFTVEKDIITLKPKKESESLEEMLERITPENLHEEHFTDLVGREKW